MIGTGNGIGIGAGNGLLSSTWGAGEELFKNDYFVYILEQIGGDFLRGRIDGEFYIDDTTKFFDYFSGTIDNKPYSGTSFYNTSSAGWVSIETTQQAQNLGWSGGGFRTTTALNLNITQSFNFHIALKSSQSYDFNIIVGGAADSQASVTFGASAGAGIDFVLPRDGRWHSFEIPAQTLVNKGLSVGQMTAGQYYLKFELGNSVGNGLEVDATYFYNPNVEMVTQQAQAPAAPEAPAAPPAPSYTDLPVPEGPALPAPTGQLLTGFTIAKSYAQESFVIPFSSGTNKSITGFDLFNFCFNTSSNKKTQARASYHEQGDTYNIRYDVVKNTCPYNPKVLLKTSEHQTVAQGAIEISSNSDVTLGTNKSITVTPNIADLQLLFISFEWEVVPGSHNLNCDNEEFRFGVENFEIYKS